MNYLGDYPVGATVFVWFNTFSSNDPSASVTATDILDTDIGIFKDDGLTERVNTTGVTIDIDVDTFAGVHKFTIDTSDNTIANFWEAGHDYACVIIGGTVDAGAINACIATFSIANRRTAGQVCQSSIEGLTDQNTFTLTSGEASAVDDTYNDCIIVVTDQTTPLTKAVGYISDYTGSTRSIQLYADPLQTGFTMAVADSVEIFATSAFGNVHTVNRTAQTANDNSADINSILADTGTDGVVVKAAGLDADAVAEIADGIWNEAISGHTTQGTYGERFSEIIGGTVDNATFTPTTTAFEADDITEATADHFNGRVLVFTTGALAGQATDITDYELANSKGKFTVTALTEAPANNVEFLIY